MHYTEPPQTESQFILVSSYNLDMVEIASSNLAGPIILLRADSNLILSLLVNVSMLGNN